LRKKHNGQRTTDEKKSRCRTSQVARQRVFDRVRAFIALCPSCVKRQRAAVMALVAMMKCVLVLMLHEFLDACTRVMDEAIL
jgi:hypothetical protein